MGERVRTAKGADPVWLRELARHHELRQPRLAGRHVGPALDIRLKFRERAGRDTPVRPLGPGE
jgi:hypothetical protein